MVRHPSTGWNLLMAGPTFSMEAQAHLRYHNGQNQGKEYWVLKKVEVSGCGQLW